MNLQSLLEDFGVSLYGIVEESTPSSYPSYLSWIERGDHGALGYLADERKDKRADLRNYFPNFSQALVMSFDYAKASKIMNEFYHSSQSNGLKIASYVLGFEGLDYHYFLRDILSRISDKIKESYPEVEIQFTLDTQPVLERDLAFKAGLGWFGKNSMLINKDKGSFFIIGSLLLSQKIFKKESIIDTDHCGNCTRCIDLCPTNAIDIKSRTIVADKCISTFTIELFKDATAPKGHGEKNGEIYGCDICQDVCPWNKKYLSKIEVSDSDYSLHFESNALVIDQFLVSKPKIIIDELEKESNRSYRKRLASSPLSRTGRVGMIKNLKAIKQNQ